MENVIAAIFNVESEAYRAFSELKQDMVNTSCTITQMALVKKKGGQIVICEGYDTGITTTDDIRKGGLIGLFVGVLGGPLGMLFGSTMGALVGSAIDASDSENSGFMIEHVSKNLNEGEVALIALAMETGPEMFDARLTPYQTTIIRWDAATVAQEVEIAESIQKEMAAEAKKKIREAKKAEKKQDIEKKREKIRADFKEFKKKFEKKNDVDE